MLPVRYSSGQSTCVNLAMSATEADLNASSWHVAQVPCMDGARGARGEFVRVIRSPSRSTVRTCFVPVQYSFHEMSIECSTVFPPSAPFPPAPSWGLKKGGSAAFLAEAAQTAVLRRRLYRLARTSHSTTNFETSGARPSNRRTRNGSRAQRSRGTRWNQNTRPFTSACLMGLHFGLS